MYLASALCAVFAGLGNAFCSYRQCAAPELKVFATKSKAHDFIDSVNTGDIAEIVSKQYARAEFPDNF